MLIEFKVKNFRSFHDETVLSMVASSDRTLPENSIVVPAFGNRSLLRSAVIYGANAAGKTNLITAISFVETFVMNSMDKKLDEPIDIKPFLLTSNTTDPSEFEITFLDDEGIRYQYGFHVTIERVTREWLIAYPKGLPQTWFERVHSIDSNSEPSWHFGRNLKGPNFQRAELTRPDMLFLSMAAKLNHRQLSKVYQWFQKSLHVINTTDQESGFLTIYSAVRAQEDDRTRDIIQTLIKVADFGISHFEIREKTITDKDLPEDMPINIRKEFIDKKSLDVFMYHPVNDEHHVPLPLEDESAGMQRYFALSGPLAQVLENGWTLFVDELDSSLHPLLVRNLVELFHNPKVNSKGAQLIFNTHDTTLMDCCLFRRDQIWFVEKDRQGCSHLYPLLDFRPRKEEALAKGYLLGRYGAIPFLGEPYWGEEVHAKDQAT